MASSSSVVWVCSRIGGLTKNLNKLLPSVQFVQVTEDKLKNMESGLDGTNISQKPQVLIADNAIIPRLMYVGSVPFKFIQGTRTYSDPILSQIDETSSLSKVPICRFAYPNFAKLISDNVLTHVLEIEKSKRQRLEIKTDIDWINEQIEDEKLLKDIKIGVLGLGKLGKHIAKAFKEHGSETYGLVKHMWSIDPNSEGSFIDHYCVMDPGQQTGGAKMVIKGEPVDVHFGIDDLLKRCDYICNVLPKSPDTDNILGGGKLQLCQENGKGTVLINVGRSDIIEATELLEAVNRKWIREAKIGVFDPEPLASTHPFYNHPNIVLNCIAPVARPLDVANCFKMNYERFIARQSLFNTINYVTPFTAIQ